MSDAPILVGADGSEQGDEAIRQGDDWARRTERELVVCHVAPRALGVHMLLPRLYEQDAMAELGREAKLEDALREHVARLTGREPGNFRVVIASGAADAELVRLGEEEGAGLIVVGSHGHSGLQHVFLGDIAERVVRHALGSVLVARPHARTGRILIGTDFSEGSRAAVGAAVERARAIGAQITIACSVERQIRPADTIAVAFGAGYGFVQAEYEAACREARKRLAEELAPFGATAEERVLEGSPAAAIVKAAGEIDAELVVLGAVGHGGLRRMLLGRIAEKVARSAPCSVLIARAG